MEFSPLSSPHRYNALQQTKNMTMQTDLNISSLSSGLMGQPESERPTAAAVHALANYQVNELGF